MKKYTKIFFNVFILLFLLTQNITTSYASKKVFDYEKEYLTLKTENNKLQTDIDKLKADIGKTKNKAVVDKSVSNSSENLSNKDYRDQKEIEINNNNPEFSKADLDTSKGGWEAYSSLDNLNRAHFANALLNKSMMPSSKRESLSWNPTGWHNKRISNGWLYNRSHLIGYQLSGQNNNPKNLITGTRELNSPEMLAHEMDIAYYLKNNPNNFVRYRVTPIYRGNELLARGVQMEAQSIGSDEIHFNIYIFNIQDGVTLNYSDGTSQITGN